MNLGSPDSTSTGDVRRYLNEFLMDERVIDKPWLLRALLVKGIIIPTRAPKSAEAYKSIWTDQGSPLIVISKQLEAALQKKIDEPVTIAMRYGNPTPSAAYDKLLATHPDLEEVILVPMYPHYAMSSYETAVEEVKRLAGPLQAGGGKPFAGIVVAVVPGLGRIVVDAAERTGIVALEHHHEIRPDAPIGDLVAKRAAWRPLRRSGRSCGSSCNPPRFHRI